VTPPTVSVIVPIYQAERYLAEALDSVMSQTHRPIELIMVDDGSTDRGADLAQRWVPPGLLISRDHRGIGATRNAGIAAATGALVAFCDADDLWEPTKLERQIEQLAHHPELAGVFCAVHEFVSPELSGEVMTSRQPQLRAVGASSCALLIRREVLADLGPFDETLVIGEWFDWYSRMQRSAHAIGNVDEVLVRRRLHTTNNSLNEVASRREYLEVLQNHLRARRPEAELGPGA
jgi:glycosyltransferase involved in cell wall biosynthesis